MSQELDATTKKILLGLAIFFAGLIGIVVFVAMIQGTLDPTGTATLLSGIFMGIVSGILLRKGGDDKDDK